MGLPECDIIAEGKKADLILIDLQQPNMQPIQNLEKNLVYSGSKQNVKLTMVAGKVLYEDGNITWTQQKKKYCKGQNESARRILG